MKSGKISHKNAYENAILFYITTIFCYSLHSFICIGVFYGRKKIKK